MIHFHIMRAVVICALICLGSSCAFALSRAYVAASGKDSNACTLSKPCRTVDRALNEIGSRGTVTIIESGEYSSFTFTGSEQTPSRDAPPLPAPVVPKFITIEAAPGVVANITADTGGVPIDIKGSSQDALVLRNLHVDVISGSIGIACSRIRALYIDSCIVSGFNVGINFKARGRMFLSDSILRENATGVVAASETGPSIISIEHCRIEDNGITGLSVGSGADVVMRDTTVANSARYGVSCIAQTANNPASILIENSSITGGAYNCLACKDGVGVFVGSGNGIATVWLSHSTVAKNRTGLQIANQGTMYTSKDNRLGGNDTDVDGILKDWLAR